jgi:hypothetical protein
MSGRDVLTIKTRYQSKGICIYLVSTLTGPINSGHFVLVIAVANAGMYSIIGFLLVRPE